MSWTAMLDLPNNNHRATLRHAGDKFPMQGSRASKINATMPRRHGNAEEDTQFNHLYSHLIRLIGSTLRATFLRAIAAIIVLRGRLFRLENGMEVFSSPRHHHCIRGLQQRAQRTSRQ